MRSVHFTDNSSAWRVIAADGTGYQDLAAMAAAGKSPWPGLDPGMYPHRIRIRSENGSGASGAAFYVAINQGKPFSDLSNDAARDDVAHLVSVAGEEFQAEGPAWQGALTVHNVWIRKTTGTNEVILTYEI